MKKNPSQKFKSPASGLKEAQDDKTIAQKNPQYPGEHLKPGSKVVAGPAKHLSPSKQKKQNAPAPTYVIGIPSSDAFQTFQPPGQEQEQGPDLGAQLADLCAGGTLGNALVKAVKDAHGLWKLQAHFRNIKIMAVSAIGTPGCLTGPDLEYLILHTPEVLTLNGLAEQVAEAVAEGVDRAFDRWRSHVTVPGLPWYPAFAAWPGPMAPPTPNVPFPLISCVSGQVTAITVPNNLKSEIFDALPQELRRPEITPLLDQVSTLLAAYFGPWLASQQVSLVLGKGPVPSFAPPFVPVGPVVNGSIIEAPRHLN